MADEPQEVCEECEEGAPEWMGTFADLCTLLLCFFVLLLSFSQMDVAKFKELRGSLEKAFGVQRIDPVYDMPKGMTFVAKEFDQVFIQQPIVGNNSHDGSTVQNEQDENEQDAASSGQQGENGENEGALRENAEESAGESAGVNAGEQELAALLKQLADEGIIEIETNALGQITLRLLGTTTFDSGRSSIQPSMTEILNRIGTVIGKTNRDIIVAGHTDNVPLQGGTYGSNLGLSAARAASVVDFFLSRNLIPPEKIATLAFGEHRPLVPNTSPENREKNRRVEIILAAVNMPYDKK